MSRDGKVTGAWLGRIPWLGKSSVQMDAKRALRIGALGVSLLFFLVYVCFYSWWWKSPHEATCYLRVLNANGHDCSYSLLLHCSIASLTHVSFLPLPPRCLLGSHDTHKYMYLRRRERKVNVYGHVTRVLQSHALCITYTRIWYTSNPDNPIYLTLCDGACIFTWLIVPVL
jgi:hypothetical protein